MTGVFRHLIKLAAYAVRYQLMEALAKYVGVPDLLGIILKFICNIIDQLFALFLRADQRRYLCGNIGTDNMYSGRRSEVNRRHG